MIGDGQTGCMAHIGMENPSYTFMHLSGGLKVPVLRRACQPCDAMLTRMVHGSHGWCMAHSIALLRSSCSRHCGTFPQVTVLASGRACSLAYTVAYQFKQGFWIQG